MDELVIDKRFEGMPGVSHGGYVAGLAAKQLGPSVAVTLTKVVPPGSTVTFERSDSQVVLRVDGEVAATAVPSQLDTTAPEPVAGKRLDREPSKGYRERPPASPKLKPFLAAELE